MEQKITFGFERQSHCDFGFPYIAQARDDGTNYGYKDLKKHPHLIDHIPELRGWTELKDLIHRLNTPESVFRSVGCEAGAVDNTFEDFAKKVGCYVQIAFEEYEFNQKEKYYDQVYSGIYYHAADYNVSGRVHVHSVLKPTKFDDFGGAPGFTMSIDISGLAETEMEARAAWAQAIPIISGAFQRISAGWETFKLSAEQHFILIESVGALFDEIKN